MIHLSKISINSVAIAYVDWQAEAGKRRGVRVYFNFSTDGCPGDSYFFQEDSEDAHTLARELKRPGWTRKSWSQHEPKPAFDLDEDYHLTPEEAESANPTTY